MESSESKPPKVFISYSHDSQEHEDRVLSLADRLRTDGIDAVIDQYVPVPPNGFRIWSSSEINRADFVLIVCTEIYRRRAERGEEPGKGRGVLWEATLIFNDLYQTDSPSQKYIPILFNGVQPNQIPVPLQTLRYYSADIGEGYQDLYRHLTGQHQDLRPALGTLKSLPAKEPLSYPSSLAGKPEATASTNLAQRHRQQLIKQVRLDWIDGVLDQSLYKVARIELGLIEHPLNTMIRSPEMKEPRAVPAGAPMIQLFDEHASALLILGAPGTGKTTLLLELARDLLRLAEHDENQPIPVVFNLASWAVRRQPLRDWMIAELNERSYIPKKVATAWVESEQILPLLDGLDEVALEHRNACVEAINNFRREYGLLPIAVCSRTADYESLGTKLRLRTAIEVQPLTRSQIEDYLQRGGEPLRGLRAGVEGDESLWELLETPLMLWVAMLSYRDVPHTVVKNVSLEQRRSQLFGNFVEAMFRRREGKGRYGVDQTTRWLSSLARILTRNDQTVFYLESLDFEWLPTPAKLGQAVVGLTVSIALIFGVSCGLISGEIDGFLGGMIGMLTGGVILGLFDAGLQPVKKTGFRWTEVSSRKSALRYGLFFGLLFALVFGLSFGLFFGLVFGLTVGLIVGLLRLFTAEAIPETRSAVNEGTHSSIQIASMSLLITGLIFVPSFEWVYGLGFRLMYGLRVGPVKVLNFGLIFGLSVTLIFGGMFVLKHFVLRLLLWKSGSAPLHFVAFLAQAKDLLFLRQVGGGYIFVHRLLREYFASLPAQE